MAGLLIIEDDEEQALGLPSGEFELPLIIQDRRFSQRGDLTYRMEPGDLANGLLGETVFINGVPDPYLEVAPTLYRLRCCNAGNARLLRLAFEDRRPFHVIGTDGGLLASPEQVEAVFLGPAERLDLLVDLSDLAIGQSLMLRSVAFSAGAGHAAHGGGVASVGPPQGSGFDLLRLDVVRPGSSGSQVPAALSKVERLDRKAVTTTRVFEMAASPGKPERGLHRLNGQLFDLYRVDEQVPLGATEIWEFRSLDEGGLHPMHVHGVQFQVLSRQGSLLPTDRGWRDTVMVFPEETVRVIARFGPYTGHYLVHCHILEHEDDGMMLNFEVL
jgi:FtsP/CotA-like multicopper oxidase with cupredoxin domain